MRTSLAVYTALENLSKNCGIHIADETSDEGDELEFYHLHHAHLSLPPSLT